MIIAAVMMSILTIYSWQLNKKAALPAILFCGAWAIVFVLQSLFARDMYSSPFATLIILTISIFYVIGTNLGVGVPRRKVTNRDSCDAGYKNIVYDDRARARLGTIVVVMGVLSILGALQYMQALGLFKARNISEMILMTGAVRIKTFSDEIQVGMIDKIGLLVAYSGVVISATYWVLFRWRWWLLLSTIGVLVIGAAQAGRAGTLMVVLQWGCAVLLRHSVDRNYHIPKKLLLLPLFIVLIFILGQLLREGFSDVSLDAVMSVMHSSRSYLFGGISAFAVYCDYIWAPTYISWGRYSFSSLYSALGIAKQEVGIYDTYVSVSPKDDLTNVYTALRSFIDDFTLLGAILAFFIIGVIIGYYYGRLLKGDYAAVAFLIPAFSFLLFSPMASLTYFNSFLLSLILPYVLCRWSLRPRRKACKI